MNKVDFLQWKQKDLSSPIVAKSKVIQKSISETEPDITNRTIELRIELDSWSPIYNINKKTFYREKLAVDVFEKDSPIEEQEINSYVDHNISISNLIASTKDNSMKVFKSGNTIYAHLTVNENDMLSKKAADLIEAGVVTSNSFIFQNQEMEVEEIENKDTKEITFDIVYKQGKLISIDPVFQGFFPQDECRVFDKNNKLTLKTLNTHKENQNKEVPIMEQLKKETVEVLDTVKKEAVVETVEVKKEVETPETVLVEKGHFEALNQVFETVAENNKIQRDILLNQTMKPVEKTELTYKEVKAKFLAQEDLTIEEREFLNNANRKAFDNDERTLALMTGGNSAEFQVIKKSLDGTSAGKGLALIETLKVPGILSEWNQIFPELTEFATKIPLLGLNKIQQNILVGSQALITSVAEGADSTLAENQTTSVMLNPVRYSAYVSQNNALNDGALVLAKQTVNVQNNIIKSLRKAFYTNLLKNVGTNLNVSTYDGGATKEAVIDSKEVNKLSLVDLDNLYKSIVAEYGEEAVNKYYILMHTETLQHLEELYWKTTGNDMFKATYDPINSKFRGLEIKASTYYTDKVAGGKHPVTLITKDSVTAYGLDIKVIDNPYLDMSKDQHQRFISTRGEVKMCDPNIHTRVIKIKTS